MKKVDLYLDFNGIPELVGTVNSNGARHAVEIFETANQYPIPGMVNQDSTTKIPFWLKDVLPDAWGERVMLHEMKKAQLSMRDIGIADRLSFIGSSGLGAWTFRPSAPINKNLEHINDLQWIREQTLLLLKEQPCSVDWMRGSLSLGGARPKVFVDLIDGNPDFTAPPRQRQWILKLPGDRDPANGGNWEFAYALMAKDFKLDIPEVSLIGGSHFAIKRFDFDGRGERHLIRSLSGLNELPHKDAQGNGYETVIDHLSDLVKDLDGVRQVVRLALFNHLMLNRDDHAKNISFMMDGKGQWKLAPFYDITYNLGLGAQGMSINNQTTPILTDFIQAFGAFGYGKSEILRLTDQLGEIVAKWTSYMDAAQIPAGDDIQSEILGEFRDFLPTKVAYRKPQT